jgi:glycosyltransferase involved in cell wall biosynthesis
VRILYDGLIYYTQAAGGINRYFANVIDRLPSADTPILTTPIVRSLNFPGHANLQLVKAPNVRSPALAYPLQAAYLRRRERHVDFDIVHPTFYAMLTWRAIKRVRKPVVMTVWDMTHEIYRSELDRFGIQAHLKRKAVTAADAVLCISENTRQDLLERYEVPEERVRVIPLATEMNSGMITGNEDIPHRPFLLFVGSRAAYKNFDLLLEALSCIAPQLPELDLCIVGAPLTEAERRRAEELRIAERLIEAGHTDDRRLAALYANAVTLVYPSKYEGFGIPPLEAMACGGIAITSNTSSLPEVVGDAAVTFDPNSLDALVDALDRVIGNETLRSELVKRGAARSSLFSWDRTASATYEVYRALTASG